MNKRVLLPGVFIASLFILLTLSCEKKVGKQPVVTAPPPPGACDTITYNKHIKPIIDGNCVSCHGATGPSGGVSLTNYSQVKASADAGRIKARVIDGNPSFMPQGGQLPQNQKDLIQCWLDNGKKEQ